MTIYGASWNTGAPAFDDCLYFDGSNDNMKASSYAPSSVWTVCFWFYTSNIGQANERLMMISDGTYEYQILLNNNQLIGRFWTSSTGDIDTTGGSNLSSNTWYFAVVKFDNNNEITIKINNSDYSSVSNSNITAPTSSTLVFGSRSNNANYYQGKLSDIRVYETELTSEEISTLYNNGNGYQYPLDATTPTVTTSSVTNISSTTATGGGNITDTGGIDVTERGICWSTSTNPTTSDSKAYDTGTFGTGSYTKNMTGLSPGTTYHVRAYAINDLGTSYGSDVQFTTAQVHTKTFTANAVLVNRLTKSFTTNAVLVNRLTKSFTIDANLFKTFTKTFSTNAVLVNRLTKTFTANAYLINRFTKTLTANALLKKTLNKTFTVDANLQKTFTKTFTVDANLSTISSKTYSSKFDDSNAIYDNSTFDYDNLTIGVNSILDIEAQEKSYRQQVMTIEQTDRSVRSTTLTVQIPQNSYRNSQLTVRGGTKYVVIEPKITKKINEVSKAVVQVIGSSTNTDFDIGNYLVVKSQPYTLFRGTIRKKSLTHSKMEVILEAYDDLIKTTKKIYEDGGSTIKKWEGVDTDTIISDLASKAGLGAGKIDTTGTNYNFSIQTDTVFNGLKRNLRLTGYEVYVSSQSDGSDY